MTKICEFILFINWIKIMNLCNLGCSYLFNVELMNSYILNYTLKICLMLKIFGITKKDIFS